MSGARLAILDREGAATPGNKVGILREALGMSQQAMADLLGVTRGTVSSYEGRSNASPSPLAVKSLAVRFGLPLAWFYDTERTAPPMGAAQEDAPREALRLIADRLALILPDSGDQRTGETPEAFARRVRAIVAAAVEAGQLAAAFDEPR